MSRATDDTTLTQTSTPTEGTETANGPGVDADVKPLVKNPEIHSTPEGHDAGDEIQLLDRQLSDAGDDIFDSLFLREPRVSVVIPARNEARNLPIVFERIPENVYEIVLVDGDSTDGTAEVARSLRPNVRIVGQDRPGKGNALICGFDACRGDIVVMIDADGSMDAGEIPLFVQALVDGADFVKGSRYMDGGGSSDITHVRSAGNRALRSAVNVLFGTRYSDLCYGYSAFWRWTLPYLELDCDGFEIETLMNIRARTARLRIAEVPSFESERVFGESNLNAVRDGLRILRTIAGERARGHRGRRRLEPAHAEPAPVQPLRESSSVTGEIEPIRVTS